MAVDAYRVSDDHLEYARDPETETADAVHCAEHGEWTEGCRGS
jgi:hypothetical protein